MKLVIVATGKEDNIVICATAQVGEHVLSATERVLLTEETE